MRQFMAAKMGCGTSTAAQLKLQVDSVDTGSVSVVGRKVPRLYFDGFEIQRASQKNDETGAFVAEGKRLSVASVL